MNIQDNIYFDHLTRHRGKLADALDDPALRGVKTSVVEKYSDQAHFIYELLQNADDAQAKSVRFELQKDKLIFAHNGSRRFSVSNPATEEEDSANGGLGDINAITSIANSNKREREASIGKFGVGFKSVFQYTSTPHIYDPNIFFKIERFIVPTKINDDFIGRKTDETLFVFPFDHSERDALEAYEDISEKLRSLDYPLLFLSYLEDISFETSESSGLYSKSIKQMQLFGDTVAEQINLTQYDSKELYEDNLWLFSRKDSNGNYIQSVSFSMTKKILLQDNIQPSASFLQKREQILTLLSTHRSYLLTVVKESRQVFSIIEI